MAANFEIEKTYWQDGFKNIAGVAEAGRGCLAGPVVAAAVILPVDGVIPKLNDSKKLSAKIREALFPIIKDSCISYVIGIVENQIIDEINILQATYRAMKVALGALNPIPDFVFVDGGKIPELTFPQLGIIKGDSKSLSVAAASVLAKVTRDEMMIRYNEIYPGYHFDKHKGYCTKQHVSALKQLGICDIHRRSFAPIKSKSEKQLSFVEK